MLKAAHEPGISAKIVVLPGASYRLLDVGLPLRPMEQFVRGEEWRARVLLDAGGRYLLGLRVRPLGRTRSGWRVLR